MASSSTARGMRTRDSCAGTVVSRLPDTVVPCTSKSPLSVSKTFGQGPLLQPLSCRMGTTASRSRRISRHRHGSPRFTEGSSRWLTTLFQRCTMGQDVSNRVSTLQELRGHVTTRTARLRAIDLADSDALKAFVDARAACRQLAVNGFYPDPNDAAGTVAAKAICGRCLVRSECLTWALTTREQFGVWGGLSEAERAA